MDAALKMVLKMAGVSPAVVEEIVGQLPQMMNEGVPQFIAAVTGIHDTLKSISEKQDRILAILESENEDAPITLDATPISLGSKKSSGRSAPAVIG